MQGRGESKGASASSCLVLPSPTMTFPFMASPYSMYLLEGLLHHTTSSEARPGVWGEPPGNKQKSASRVPLGPLISSLRSPNAK